MGRIIFIFLLALFFSVDAASAQTDSELNIKQSGFIEGNYTDFYADNLNNIYLVTASNQIKKLNDRSDSVAVSNALKKYGNIYSVDVSNPLKIAVFYKDFSTVVVLDRFLSNINTIDLRKFSIIQTSAIAQSYDNNYWVFDAIENKLDKIDDNGNILLQTPDFRTIFKDAFQPQTIIDNNGFVYLYDVKHGWLIFDYYGAYKQTIPQPSLMQVQVIKNELYGFDSALHLHRYNTRTFNEATYTFEKIQDVKKFQIAFNSIYALTKSGLIIFTINNN